MKKFTLGKQTYHLLESSQDTNSARWAEFQKYVILVDRGCTAGDLARKAYQYQQNFNEEARADCLLTLMDFRQIAENIEYGTNYLEYLFALIVLREEELDLEKVHQHIDQNYLAEKVKEFQQQGLTPRLVTDTLAAFTLASPKSFPLDFLTFLERLLRYLAQTTEPEEMPPSDES